jgi:hypothetical protein
MIDVLRELFEMAVGVALLWAIAGYFIAVGVNNNGRKR